MQDSYGHSTDLDSLTGTRDIPFSLLIFLVHSYFYLPRDSYKNLAQLGQTGRLAGQPRGLPLPIEIVSKLA